MRLQILDILSSHSKKFGSRIALQHGFDTVTYGQLNEVVSDISRELKRATIPPYSGVYVNNTDGNWCSKFVLYLALILNKNVPILRPTADAGIGDHAEIGFSLRNPHELEVLHLPKSHFDFRVHFDDPLDVLFSSGTTGKNKPIIFAFSHFVAELNPGSPIEYRSSHLSVPFYTSTGVHAIALRGFLAGHTSICLESPRTWRELADDISSLRLIELTTTPFALEHLTKNQEYSTGPVETLRYMKIFAGSLTDSLRAQLQIRLPKCKILSIYGLSEAAGVSLKRDKMGRIFESFGKEASFRVWSEGRNQWADIGETGDILAHVRNSEGPPKVIGEISDELLPKNWIRTGDVGIQSGVNEIMFLGRSKEFLIVGGKRVPSYELEERVNQLVGGSSCILFNKSDNDSEAVCLVVEVEDESRQETLIRSSILGSDDELVVIFVQSLDRTGLGKINRSLNIRKAMDIINSTNHQVIGRRHIYWERRS